MKNKRIAFVTPLYIPANLSGSSIVIKDVAEELARQGYDISVITSDALTARYWYDPIFGKSIKKKYETLNGVKIYRLKNNQILSSILFILVRYLYFLFPQDIFNKMKIAYNGPYLMNLKNLLKKEKFTIIHSSPFPLGLNRQVAEILPRLSIKTKFIVTPFFHSEVNEFYNSELKNILEKTQIIHSVTEVEQDMLRKVFQLEDKNIITIPLFLNDSVTCSDKKIEEKVELLKDKYNLKGKKNILFAGNKGYMKGAITLLETVHDLYKQDKSYRLISIGNDSPEWINAKKKLKPEYLIDLGYVSQEEKEAMFSICDVLCMPSKSESFGLTYLEAWNKRKPVIAADIPTSRELIKKNNAGLLVKFGDKSLLRSAIIKIYREKKLSKDMGSNGHIALKKYYVFTQFIKKFKTILE